LLSNGVNYNFVKWDSSETTLQDVDITLNLTLPDNFDSWATTDAISIDYQTQAIAPTNNYLKISISNNSGTYAPSTEYTSDTWSTITISASDLVSLNASNGDTITLALSPYAANGSFVKLGKIAIKYYPL
jgi:hypothetical protein